MKEKFAAFYRHSTEEDLKKIWKDKKTLFVFDTNILLSIYSYNKQGKDLFFKILKSLEGRVWLPFHVGLEYQRNRVKIIRKATNDFETFKLRVSDFQARLNADKSKIDAIYADYHNLFKQHENFKEDYDEFMVYYNNFLNDSKNKLEVKTSVLFKKIENIEMEPIMVDGFDGIRDELDRIFTNSKVGDCLFKDGVEMKKFNEEANTRFENKIPPGFSDEKNKGDSTFFYGGIEYFRKYGDLIIFKELINKAKNDNAKYDNLIFITDDSKQDWIETIKINNEDKKIGVLHSLKEEVLRESKIKDFMIFDQESFIKNTNNFILSGKDDESFKNLIKNIQSNISENLIVVENSDLGGENNRRDFEDYFLLSNCDKKDNSYEYSNFLSSVSKLVENDKTKPTYRRKSMNYYIQRCKVNNYFGDNHLRELFFIRNELRAKITGYKEILNNLKDKNLLSENNILINDDEEYKSNVYMSEFNEIEHCEKILNTTRKRLIEVEEAIVERYRSIQTDEWI
ncbi:PIN-like domain-containing protein [Acinetobacter dispersus]|uniref:PIN-like domain-containing protein n=1 Tax=Acinetobacter dispersus TaxID=70348 RepID=UPI001F4B9CC4|nr:PIN-like domain-containing protein [Acinetobacter dispersus]MCH7393761.1 PIN-like domain-containing protein [Acinetobacter dispersus]